MVQGVRSLKLSHRTQPRLCKLLSSQFYFICVISFSQSANAQIVSGLATPSPEISDTSLIIKAVLIAVVVIVIALLAYNLLKMKQVERRASEHSQLLDLFVRHVPSAVAMFDSDMRYLAYSERWLEDYQLGDTDILGKSHYQVFPEIEKLRPDWIEDHHKVLSGGVVECDRDSFVRADGRTEYLRYSIHPWLDADGDVGGLIMFTEITTAQVEANLAIEQNQEKLRLAFELSPIGMALVSPEGEWLRVNQALTDYLGYSEQEILNLDFQTITHADDLESDLEQVERLLEGDIKNYQMEKRYIHKDGSVLWASLSVGLVRDGNDEPLHFISQILDITKRKMAQDKLSVALEELELANKELSQFAYVASHDLKAPLRGIDNLAKWVEEDLAEVMTDDARQHLELLRGRVHRLEQLLEDILTYSRAGRISAEPTSVDVSALLQELISSRGLEERARIVLPDEFPVLETHRTSLEQVFANLISNAAKHNPESGGRITVGYQERGEFIEFFVTDEGPGIPEQYQEKVFEMFQTLKSRDAVEGSGLGMAIVRKLVEWQSGRVWIESDGESGTTIRFLWPSGFPSSNQSVAAGGR